MLTVIVGAGTMGSGIAQLAAMNGHRVALRDVSEAALDSGLERIESSLARFVRAGRLDPPESAGALGRIEPGLGLIGPWPGDPDIVIETVTESFEVKREVWQELAPATPPTAVLATNTSQISITRLAAMVGKAAERFIGLHFFNPPVMMQLVEVVRGLETSDETHSFALDFVASLGREAVTCLKDSPGFITTRAYAALRMECLRIVEEGIASPADVDRALKLAFNLPMGPLELADFNGLDVVLAAMEDLAEAHGERFRPTVGLRNVVAAGRLGRKSGAGFFDYEGGAS